MKATFSPLAKKILTMALNNDDRLCSFYAKELFEHINLADVVRKEIRLKLSLILSVEYDYVKDIIFYTEKRVIIKNNKKKTTIGIYRIDNRYKKIIRRLLKK